MIQGLAREDNEPQPDAAEGDKLTQMKSLAIGEHRQQEHGRRRQVLKEPQNAQRQAHRGGCKAHQWYYGYRPGGAQQHHLQRYAARQGTFTLQCRVDQVTQRQRQHERGFQPEPDRRTHRQFLTHQTVEPEAYSQGEAHPGKQAHGENLVEHPEAGQRQCSLLRRPQPLAEEQHAEQHVEQRIDEIPQTGIEHTGIEYGPDEQYPVGRDERTADRQPAELVRLEGSHRGPLAAQPDHHGQDQNRPDDPVGHHFRRIGKVQQLEVDRRNAPQTIGADGKPDTRSIDTHAGGRPHTHGASRRGVPLRERPGRMPAPQQHHRTP